MAIQEPPEGMPLPTHLNNPNAAANAVKGAYGFVHEIPVPRFDSYDPAKPGHLETAHVVTDQIHPDQSSQAAVPPQPSTEQSKEKPMKFFDATSILNNVSASLAKRKAAAAPDTTPTPDTTSPTTADKEAKKAMDTANDSSKVTARKLKTIRIFGACAGAASVIGLCAWGVKSQMATEAAAAASASAETATVITEGAAASTGIVSTIVGAVTSEATVLGVTAPLWGFAAAAVGAAIIGYGAYKLYKHYSGKKGETAKSADQPKAAGVTVGQAIGEFSRGFASGFIETGMIAGVVLLAGTIGVHVMDASTVRFGEKYGPVVAVGGTVVGTIMALSSVSTATEKWNSYNSKCQAEKTKQAQSAQPAAAAA